MPLSCLNDLNNSSIVTKDLNFTAQKAAVQNNPIEKLVEKVDEEKKKKHNKIAVAVGGSVLSLSLLITLFNPRISSKLISHIKQFQSKITEKINNSKGHLVKTKFYKVLEQATNWCSRFIAWTNNINSVKDTYYKQLCTEEKTFFGIKDLERRKRFAKFDKFFRKIMKSPHELITKWGDSLAKKTVKKNYKKADKRMNDFEQLIREYSERLSNEQKQDVNEMLIQVQNTRKYFANDNLEKRFLEQEQLMQNLNDNIRKKWGDYRHGFTNKYVNNVEHFNNNLSFWAQDILEKDKTKITKHGIDAIDNLMGKEGTYKKLIEKVSECLNTEEKNILNKSFDKTKSRLIKANNIECNEYFDKKRDLILGSAPTDILSSVIFLSIGGVSLASTNDRDKRISRLITSIIPTVAGIGINIALTAMLFSGTKGLIYGIAGGGILSLIGSKVDKLRLSAKNKLPEE